MDTKLLSLVVIICLSGCLTNKPGQVFVEEKSFNMVESSSQVSKTQPKKTNIKKNWSLPVDSPIKKNYSENDGHYGLTFDNAVGQEVRSVRKGEVVYSGDRMATYGKMIIIKHAYGFYSIYNQNQELLVSEGDTIEKGQLIAITGDKPFYFEMKKYEDPINPLKYL
ncbi:M23 family metallopeptidase [Candidatus Thioglobus sp.]|nr:M23 family metallopeptidase [Candidatus Thioglobus sp.]|tara:strand:+ start:251 stop:748 length:498 start_codon:yes stop_codon:yes gene_type:complete